VRVPENPWSHCHVRSYAVFPFLALLSLLAIAAAFSCAQIAAQSRQQRAQDLRSMLANNVAKLKEHLQRDPDPVEIREITNGALVALSTGDPAFAEKLLRLAYDQQNMRPGPNFGEMPWNLGTRTVHDANSIDFATESLGPILVGHARQLSPAFLAYIRPHATASLEELARQKVPVSYTNIYVMNLTNTILIAEYMHDDAMLKRGYQNLDNWLDYTHNNGIHEFDSPVYYAVVLGALYAGYQYSTSPAAHENFHRALDYLWTDMTANYFQGGNKLAGAHSRDYDFLSGIGNIDIYYYIEGFSDTTIAKPSLEQVVLLDSVLQGGYQPSVKHFSADDVRVVTQRWDEGPERYRYTYITPNFALGIANGQYGPQDKMFAVDFAPPTTGGKGKDIPNIFLATTTTGIPYGKDRSLDRSGHSKPKHLSNGLAAVQENGFALLIAGPDAKSDKDADQFYLDMVLPAAGALTLNDKPVAVSSSLDQPIHAGDTIGIHIGKACFAVTPIAASGPGMEQMLQADRDGLSDGALRLTTTFRTSNHTESMLSAYLVYAQSCTGAGNPAVSLLRSARVQASNGLHQRTIQAQLNGTTLLIDYDLDQHASTVTKVNGVEFATAPLHIVEIKETAAAH
jgi:hypothetical protein